MFSSGLILGILLDTYHLLQSKIKLPRFRKLIICLLDIIYFVSVVIIIFCSLLWCNWGEWRIHIAALIICGFLFYLRFCRRQTLPIIGTIFTGITKLYIMLSNLFHYTVYKPIYYVYLAVKSIINVCQRSILFLLNPFWRIIKSIGHFAWNKLMKLFKKGVKK